MLSQVNVHKDPTLLGRIVKTIGRKSTIVDLVDLYKAEQKLQEWNDTAYTTLRVPVGKLTGITREDKFWDLVSDDWATLADRCTPKTKLKTGSQKEGHLKTIQKAIKDLENRKKELKRCQQSAQNDTLDPIQKQAIKVIREGKSILLMGSPGSGKTHCALYTLDVFGMKNSEDVVLYVAPTAELALQAYTNLCETFPTVSVGIVTLLLSYVTSHPKILVGTPQELWSYLCNSPVRWNKAVIDEVHTLSDHKLGYSDALHYLMMGLRGNINVQLVALSATIHEDDVNHLQTFLSEATGIQDIHCITLDPSPIPRKNYSLTSDGISPFQATQGKIDLTPALLFKAFKKIGYDGTLVFAENDVVTWELFVDMLEYLEHQNLRHYRRFITRAAEINEYFTQAAEHNLEFERIDASTKSSKRAQSDSRASETRAQESRAKGIAALHDILRKELKDADREEEYTEVITTDEEASLCKLDKGTRISLGAKYALQLLLSGSMEISEIGPYFRLMPEYRKVENAEFNAFLRMHCDARSGKITIDSSSQTEWTAVNSLIRVAESESLDVSQMKNIIRTMVTAFKYGIALMMPSLPFVVTHTIRKYLNERKIPFVFSTHEMAVGINYGLRNVFILCKDNAQFIRPSLVVQMAGRAGRRGLDRDARIIYANVAPQETIEHMSLNDAPTHEMGTEESMCCALNTILDVKLTDISPLLQTLRRDIPDTRIRVLYDISQMSKEQNVQATAETFHILQDIQAAFLGCFQLHLFYSGTPQAKIIENMVKVLRKANHLVTKGCFRLN